MICLSSFSQASADGNTLSAFHVNFLSILFRGRTLFAMGFILLDLRFVSDSRTVVTVSTDFTTLTTPVLPSLNAAGRNRFSRRYQALGPPRCGHRAPRQWHARDKVPSQHPWFV